MITTLLLNPCIDKTMVFSGDISHRGTNIAKSVCNDASGKGLNVSLVMRNFDQLTQVVGFSYDDFSLHLNRMEQHDIGFVSVKQNGATRTNVKIFEESFGEMTEFNEKGNEAPLEDFEKIFKLCERAVDGSFAFVITGSAPPNMPKDFYARLVELGNRLGAVTVLDARGEIMRLGIEKKPTIIKPNLLELSEIVGREIKDRQDMIEQCRLIVQGGVKYLCLSLGKDGAILFTKDKIFEGKAVDVTVKSLQGAGDSMVSGFLLGLKKQVSDAQLLRYALAVAAGTVRKSGTNFCEPSDFDELYPKTNVTEIGIG